VNDLRARWTLDPAVKYLNHGSFGATPRDVLTVQSELRARLERNPMQFFVAEWDGLHDAAREALGAFLGARGDDLAVVPNATAGVNAAVRAFALAPGDELLVTNHEYNACANILRDAAHRAGASLVVAEVPFPLSDPGQIAAAILAKVTPRTRLALVDHVTSQTALVFPIESIVRALRERGVETIVDGAHAPGMLALDLDAIGAAYYTGNLHKWVCAPKGAAFLHVRRDLHPRTRPLSISHGANATRVDRSRFRLEWDWTGTCDPTAFLAVPEAIRWMGALLPGGWEAVRQRNRALALQARTLLCASFGASPPAPESMIGSMAAVPLPAELVGADPSAATGWFDPVQQTLRSEFGIEVPVIAWPDSTTRWVRVSAQVYNEVEEYEGLVEALEAVRRATRGLTRART
jgi:isopenicillin-N epimerase